MGKKTTTSPDKKDTTAEKRERFLKVGGKRMQKALKAIELVGNCSSGNYIYTQDDVAKINTAFVEAVQRTLDRFRPSQKDEAESPAFKF